MSLAARVRRSVNVARTDELRLAEVRVTPSGAVLDVEVRASPRLVALRPEWDDADVRVGLHWMRSGGRALIWDGPRTETVPLRWIGLTPFRRALPVGAPPAGAVELRVELVAEGLMWGEAAGLAPMVFGGSALDQPRPALMAPRDHGPGPPLEAPT